MFPSFPCPHWWWHPTSNGNTVKTLESWKGILASNIFSDNCKVFLWEGRKCVLQWDLTSGLTKKNPNQNWWRRGCVCCKANSAGTLVTMSGCILRGKYPVIPEKNKKQSNGLTIPEEKRKRKYSNFKFKERSKTSNNWVARS